MNSQHEIWTVATGKTLDVFKIGKAVDYVLLSTDGKILAMVERSDDITRVYDLSNVIKE
jgi:hypothetical protein